MDDGPQSGDLFVKVDDLCPMTDTTDDLLMI